MFLIVWESYAFQSNNGLLNLDSAINFLDKEEAGIETNGPSKQEQLNGHDEGVAKVEKARKNLCDLQLREEVEDRVEEHVEGRSTRGKERSPPPVIVLYSVVSTTLQKQNEFSSKFHTSLHNWK